MIKAVFSIFTLMILFSKTAYTAGGDYQYECHKEASDAVKFIDKMNYGPDIQNSIAVIEHAQRESSAKLEVVMTDSIRRAYQLAFEKFRQPVTAESGEPSFKVNCVITLIKRLP